MLCDTPPPLPHTGTVHPDSAVEGSEEGWPPQRAADTIHSTAGSADALHVHVDGSDSTADGSADKPFKSLHAALQAARLAKIRRSLSTPPAILLHAGVHYLNQTLVLGPADSGQVITSADPGGTEAWISGGVPVLAPTWTRHSTAGSVFVAELGPDIAAVPALYTVSPHQRLTRARYPNGTYCIHVCTLDQLQL